MTLQRRPLLLSLLLAPTVQAAAPGAGLLSQPREADWARLPPHPRLFADAAAIARVAKQDDAVSRQLRGLLDAEVKRLAAAPAVVYPAQGLVMNAVRENQRRLLAFGMAWRLQRDPEMLARTRAELFALARRDDWGRGHFLTTGETAMAVAVGYDWLHAELSEAERAELRAALVARALLPSFEVAPGHSSWIDGDFNWAQVCHAGLVSAALAIAEHEPALARAVVARALSHLGPVTAAYGPDGGHAEGPSYWSYGTLFHILLIDVLRGSFGQAFGLDSAPGFLATADYALQMRGPSGEDFNYADYHGGRLHEPVMLWFARERGDAALARQELADLARLAVSPSRSVPSRHLPMTLLWWQPGLPSKGGELPRQWLARGVLPLVALRSAWGDPNASFIAAKGGTPNHSHAHMDVGSFVLEADGVRWAVDLGSESYDRMRAAQLDLWNYTQDSSRWTTFRAGPEAHNILRFDGAPQRVDGHATITQHGSVYRIELSSLYRGQVASVQRDIALRADRSIELTDRWTTLDRPVQARWQWLTHADVTPVPGGLLLRQAGKRLRLQVDAPGWTAEVQDVSAARAPQDSPNPGLRRIVLTVPGAAGAQVQLRVRAVPGG